MNNIKKGTEYEIYINDNLNSSDNVKISYLWKNIPEYILLHYEFITSSTDSRLNRKTNNINKLEDIGSDIIYINQENECVIVQCKNYSTNSVKIEDLGGFFCIMRKHKDKNGEIYYTNKISKKIKLIYEGDTSIKLIKKEFIQNENEIINIIQPYDYQNKVIKLAEDYYKNNQSGIISMPCGTGKTLISCYIGMNYKIVIMITPLKQYAKQNCNRFTLYEKDRNILLIDSDGTRDIDDINEFIKNNNKILLSVTYKSCDIINELNLTDDILIIFDEFHNFSYSNIYNEEDNIYQLINNESNNIKKLYLSATPRIYELENNDDIDVNEMFGDYIYKMSFNEAITNKYISDYELYLPIFISENNDDVNNLNIHEDYLLKINFLIEAIKMCGTLKMIIYLRTHKEIEKFIEEFNKINDNYYYYDVYINKITCDNTYNSRNKILDKFNNSDKISLLFSVHILDEAIDIPNCDSIYMTYVSSSKIKNIQRMSRAMRYKDKKIAKIFLFCNNIDESFEYISSIREYDTDFIKKINYLGVSYDILDTKEREKLNKKYTEQNKIKILGIKLYRNEIWNENLEKIKQYMDKYNKRPSSASKDTNIKSLGKWVSTQFQNYKNKKNTMSNNNIYNLWTEFINDDKYIEYFEDNDVIWISNLNKIKEYIDTNNKKPLRTDPDIEIKTLNKWIDSQTQKYKNKTQIMKNDNIYKLWTEFINHNKYKKYFLNNNTIWINTYNQVKKYIDNHNKRPTSIDNNKDIAALGSWIKNQLKNYKIKKEIMSNECIYNLWTELINDNKYKTYFEDNITIWINKLNDVKQYIDVNEKRPPSTDKDKYIKSLSQWICSQQTNYKTKKELMKNNEIYNLWTEFINDDKYKKYFEYNTTIWIDNLNKIKKYIDENNKRPTSVDDDEEIKILGKWINTQNTNYKNKLTIMKNAEIYNIWTQFINDDKYKIYFEDNNVVWIRKLNEVKKYIDEKNKRPSDKDKDKEIKSLGIWIGYQIQIYKNNKEIMKNEEIYNTWTDFINDDKYKKYFENNEITWINKLNELKIYIDTHNKRPSSRDKNKDIESLSSWINIQQIKYKTKTDIMGHTNIYNLWTEFINNDKYKKYFEDYITIWIRTLNELKEYIDENNELPGNPLKLWITTQKYNYNTKKHLMTNDNIYNLWTEFIKNNKYKQIIL
jgi:superfamily II DNA or RNA helicase